MLIAPSLLAADFGALRSEIHDLESSGADWLHIDVMDGSFVPPITFGDNLTRLCKKESKLFRDVHLMIDEPAQHFQSFVDSGAQGITFHIEASEQPKEDLQRLQSLGIQAGLSLRPETPVESLLPYLPFCDLLLVMTVSPGFGGQPFLPAMLDKIEYLSTYRKSKGLSFHIQVDGGIQPDTAALCVKKGADVFVAGSYILKSSQRSEAIEELREACRTALQG